MLPERGPVQRGLVGVRAVKLRHDAVQLNTDGGARPLHAERGPDAGVEVDAHGLAPEGLPVRPAAAQILFGELLQRRGRLLLADVVCGVPARADEREHVACATAGLCKLHIAKPGDDDAAAPSLDARLHNPDLAVRGVLRAANSVFPDIAMTSADATMIRGVVVFVRRAV